MLLFIRVGRWVDGETEKFQYISCYCLSQLDNMMEMLEPKFQYISCYCLSPAGYPASVLVEISIHLMLLFINRRAHSALCFANFNTSHVTVYLLDLLTLHCAKTFQYISCYCLSTTRCPTTCAEHISIHLMLLFIKSTKNCSTANVLISIHLMLLFITVTPHVSVIVSWFQYISCYCLSRWKNFLPD